MANNYTFFDTNASVQTAASSVVAGAHQPLVQLSSVLLSVPVTTSGGTSSVNVVATNPASVSGVGIFNINNVGNGSILAIVPGSVATVSSPASVSGVGVFNVNAVGNGSVLVIVPGSVATAPSPASVSGTGVFNINPTGNGSIITVWPLASIAGTYAEDSAHADGQRGLFTLGVRNDNVASFVSANLDYTPTALDSAGRTITKPFAPSEALVQGVSSTVNINPSSLLTLPGAGLRNYITDILVTNTGSVATLVSFRDSDASVIGRTIAPATSGSNIHLATPMRTGAINSQVEFTAGTAVSILGVSAYGYKAP